MFEGSAWTWNNERQQYYYHAFLPEQPTLNYRNPKVVQEMKVICYNYLISQLSCCLDNASVSLLILKVGVFGSLLIHVDEW